MPGTWKGKETEGMTDMTENCGCITAKATAQTVSATSERSALSAQSGVPDVPESHADRKLHTVSKSCTLPRHRRDNSIH